MLGVVIRGLPSERADWGQAMLTELDQVPNQRARWLFVFGCLRATAAIRARSNLFERGRDGVGVRAVVFGAVIVCLGLATYGAVRYPGLRTGSSNWIGGAILLILLTGYTVCALVLACDATPKAALARRNGLLGGLTVGGAWLAVLAPTSFKAWVFLPLLVALLVPASVAFLTARTSRDAKAATGAALWSGLVGGLLVSGVWVTTTYLRDGRPYDPQLIRDFHQSGAPDLTTYAISDNLGAALTLLAIVPTIALALGSLARLTIREPDQRRQRSSA